MATTSYRGGVHELGNGLFAYLQPDGAWGLSNAGVVASGERSLLIDTLFDLPLTRRMLDELARATPAAKTIDTVVNTHANGDHCWGNELVAGAEIIASRSCAEEMRELSPGLVAGLVAASRAIERGGRPARMLATLAGKLGVRKLGALAEAAPFVAEIFSRFSFRGIALTPPTRTFDGQLDLDIGERRVELIEVGPAHTRGDTIAWVPDARVVFTGDILFHQAHPVIWEGPVGNWIAACERILALDPEVIVPGHGPLADTAAIRRLANYLGYLERECRSRHAAGMTAVDAARDIAFDAYADWSEAERIAVNVDTVYREIDGVSPNRDPVEAFAAMAKYRAAHRATGRPASR